MDRLDAISIMLIAALVIWATVIITLMFSEAYAAQETLKDCTPVEGMYVLDVREFRPVYHCPHAHLKPEEAK